MCLCYRSLNLNLCVIDGEIIIIPMEVIHHSHDEIYVHRRII